jgi:Flp pilus assembly protein TadG
MSRRLDTERGSSLLGTALGVAILLSLTAFAADVGVGLWARSAVDAAASDAARELAALSPDEVGSARTAAAVARARSTLGPFGSRISMTVRSSAQAVAIHVTAPALGLLPRVAGGGSVVGGLDRTVVVRREAW